MVELSDRNAGSDSKRRSSFQVYTGYPKACFDGYKRSSEYVVLADGRRIAVDVLRPLRGGAVVAEPLPVLFTHTVYSRAVQLVRNFEVCNAIALDFSWWQKSALWVKALFKNGNVIADQGELFPWVRDMIESGYVVVAADAGGTGASFGTSHLHIDDYGREAHELMDWIVSQPWADGKIGMYGESFVAMISYAGVATGHPALKAIFVTAPPFDSYRDVGYPGGLYAKGFGERYISLTSELDQLAVAVDGDNGAEHLAAALGEQQQRNFSAIIADLFRTAPHSDNLGTKTGIGWYDLSGVTLLDRVKKSDVAIYNISGWRDIFARDTTLWYENTNGHKRLTMRPWHHEVLIFPKHDFDSGLEIQRWFDHWLKGMENGVDKDPDVHFYQVEGGATQGQWCEADTWPPSNMVDTTFFLGVGGEFLNEPAGPAGYSQILPSPYATSGHNSRWNGVLGTGVYPDMASNDHLGLTYTTPPLERAMEIAGHPVVRLWVSSMQDDAPVFAYLEEVLPSGKVQYLSEGMLRAAHRTATEVPYRNFGLPVHDHSATAGKYLTSTQPVLLEFDILPIAARLRRGSRLRLTLQSADADNFEPIPSGQHPVNVHMGTSYPSSLTVPVGECQPVSSLAGKPSSGK